VLRKVFLIVLIISSLFSQGTDFEKMINEIIKKSKNEKFSLEEIYRCSAMPKDESFGGEVIIDEEGDWYFKMLKIDASRCSGIYYKVNDENKKFILESVGPYPPTPAPILLGNFKKGDRIVFIIKTFNKGWSKEVNSTNRYFFKFNKSGKNRYCFMYEDVVNFDHLYNDGAFSFYKKGFGLDPNKNIYIKSYKAVKKDGNIEFSGEIYSKGPFDAKIIIRDNRWRVFRVIPIIEFKRDKNSYKFSYIFKEPLIAPAYTSIFTVEYQDEEDARVRMIKDCIDEE